MTSHNSDVRVRPATGEDREFILALVPRLMEFGPPPWRERERMVATDLETIGRVLDERPPAHAVFVAEDADGARLGFIHLHSAVDYFTREEHGHVSDVAVTRAGEGRGVGRALMEQGEAWARERGYRLLTLHVFARNARARAVYEKLGYAEDTLKCVKELR